ncbi:MAG: rhomboid family intramembrane serine protease [Phycisphaerales bacterium]
MGLYDRDYTQSEFRQQRFGLPQMRFNLPRATPVVKWLLIVNIGVFFLTLIKPLGDFAFRWLAVDAHSWATTLEPWRLLTYQFLHDTTRISHIFLNMFALYMLGPALEKAWGGRKYLAFYLICGASGGVMFLLLARIGFLGAGTMVGASGAIYGLLVACAILFPHFIAVFFIFPVPIRVMAVLFAVMSFFAVVTRSGNAGGEAAHFTGMAMGAAYVLLLPRMGKFSMKVRKGSWEKKIEEGRKLQIEVDRILAKVHRNGLHSLSSTEKRTLKRATQEEIKRHQL